MKAKALLIGLIAVIIAITADANADSGKEEQGKVFFSYKFPDNNCRIPRSLKEKASANMVPLLGTYTVKAEVSLSKEEKQDVLYDLQCSDGERLLKDGDYFWNKTNKNKAIKIPLILEPAAKSKQITNFKDLYIDYEDYFVENPNNLSMEMVLELEDSEDNIVVIAKSEENQSYQLKDLKDLDCSSIPLLKKNSWYLFKRVLGLSLDQYWRYDSSSHQNKTVIQRRFHEDLDLIKEMDFFFLPETNVTAINIRLGVLNSSKDKSSEVIYWDDLSKEILEMNNFKIFRVNFGELIRKGFAGKGKVFLEEVIIFLPSLQAEQVIRDNPLRKISFRGTDILKENKVNQTQKGYDLDISSQTMVLSKKRKRLVINMQELANRVGEHFKIKGIALKVQPKEIQVISGFHLHQAKMVGLEKNEQPVCFSILKQLCQRWGGPFLHITDRLRKVEGVRIIAYQPFHNLTGEGIYQSGEEKQLNITINADHGAFYRLLDTKEELIFNFLFFLKDASVTVELPCVRSVLEDRVVTLECKLDEKLNVQLIQPHSQEIGVDINKIQLNLSKGVTPILKIRAAADLSLAQEKVVKGSFVLKRNITSNLLDNKDTSSKIITQISPYSFTSSDTNLNIDSDNNGMLLEGEGEWVEVDWPVRARISNDIRFFLGIEKGIENIARIEVMPLFQNRILSTISVMPNHPNLLKVPSGEINGLKIRLMLREWPFQIKFTEMSLFYPEIFTHEQALNTPTLIWGETILKPKDVCSRQNIKVEEMQNDLKVVTKATNHPFEITWTTDVGRIIGWIQGLKVKYKIQSTEPVSNSYPYWLDLTLIGTARKVEKSFRLDQPDGEIFIPMIYLYKDIVKITGSDSIEKSFSLQTEVLQSINWKMRNNRRMSPINGPLGINISMSIDGVNLLTIGEEMMRHPIFEYNMQKFFLNLSTNNIQSTHLLRDNCFMDLGTLSIDGVQEEAMAFHIPYSRYINTEAILLESTQPLSSTIWKHHNRMQIKGGNIFFIRVFHSFKFGLFVITIITFWYGWRKGWWLSVWLRLSKTVYFFVDFFCHSATYLVVLFNRVIGVMSILGLYLSQKLVLGEYGKLLLYSTAVLYLGVIWHELRWFLHRRNREVPMGLYYFMSPVILGWIAYLMGRSGNGVNVTFYLFPLAAFGYLYLPRIGQIVRFISMHYIHWWFIAVCCYAVGFMANLNSGLHYYFFTFASISVVFAWSSLTLLIRSKLERRWPLIADLVYSWPGKHYFIGAIILFSVMLLLFAMKLELIATQVSVIGFYMLVIGVFFTVWHSSRTHLKYNKHDTECRK